MPGERVSCMGCHDNQNSSVMAMKPATAQLQAPAKLKPWCGPTRGFSFLREVQPVLDKYCVGCHDGKSSRIVPDSTKPTSRFPESYEDLHPFVRRNGPEGDYHILTPLGVPRRHQRSGANAAQGPSQCEAG